MKNNEKKLRQLRQTRDPTRPGPIRGWMDPIRVHLWLK